MNEEQLRETLRRCPPESVEAALEFNRTRAPELVPAIVLGIIERFVEPEVRPKVREGGDDTRILEDLGVDSLLMVEIVMTIEEVLEITAENEELRTLRTLGDIKRYLDAKIRGVPLGDATKRFAFADIVSALPHQPPFLFLHEASLEGDGAQGSYAISGDEPFLEGHFKDEPIFPASLMLESLGQLAVLYILRSGKTELAVASEAGKAYFVSADGVRCHRICRPGDTLKLKVTLKKVHPPLAVFSGSIIVNSERVAVAEELTLAFAPPQGAAQAADASTTDDAAQP